MWQSLFGIICWKLWKQRNLKIFQGILSDAANILQFEWCWMSYIKSKISRLSGSMSNRRGNYRWIPSLFGSIKIDVDGAHNLFLGLVSSTTVARDEHCRWL